MEKNLQASVIFGNKNNVWINDKMVSNCHWCRKEIGKSFGIWGKGKHHCRNCGNVFCDICSSYYIVIPSFITDKPVAEDVWNLSHYFPTLKPEKERVCKKCYDLIIEKTKAREKILSILKNPKSIDEINAMGDSNNEVKTHYYDQLRNIQYYLPNHSYNDLDKKLLSINAKHLSKHSKYLMHLIKSIYSSPSSNKTNIFEENVGMIMYDDKKKLPAPETDLEMIMAIINEEKTKTCSELYCTRICQEHFSCDDCINILYSCADNLPDDLIRYFFDIINKTPNDVLLCHLSFFINLIKKNKGNGLLTKFTFGLLNRDLRLQYQTYWFLNNAKEIATMDELRNIDQFISMIEPEKVRIMNQEYRFYSGLISHLDNPIRYLETEFNKQKPISLPYDPEIKLVAVDLKNIKINNSYTKPVMIPFETTDGRTTILFKKESLMNDVVVLNLITLSDIILKSHLNDNFDVVTYPVMPLTANSGMIEIIDEAETLYDIEKSKKTILQHIIEKNDDDKTSVSDVLNRYMYSLVSYTLHSYFLGLGDRHLQNIMIHDDGSIFHIDFGFILGKDACPFTSADVRLNSDMLEVIGGRDGTRYGIYFELCSHGIKLLRKYFNMFFVLLTQDEKFKKENIEKFIMARFQPRQSDEVIVAELHQVIKKSHNSYSNFFAEYTRDVLHYHTQEKPVPNAIGKFLKNTISLVKNLTNNSK